MSVTCVANDKSDNEIKPGAVHRSPGIYLTAEDNPGKLPTIDHIMKAVRSVIASNVVPYLQMTCCAMQRMSWMMK